MKLGTLINFGCRFLAATFLVFLIAFPLLAQDDEGNHGHYVASYSFPDGKWVDVDSDGYSATFPYSLNYLGYGVEGGIDEHPGGGSVTCSGQITATFTWVQARTTQVSLPLKMLSSMKSATHCGMLPPL